MGGQYIEPMLLTLAPHPPSQCEVCRQWACEGICADCLARFANQAPRCLRCGLRLGLAGQICGDCMREPPAFEHTVCLADYAFPWDELISAFKFGERVELAGVLARSLHARLLDSSHALPALVLPVPLAPRRLAQRGYNQAWELARSLAALLGLKARADVLLRPSETTPQAELDRAQRRNNLRTAFMVDPRLRSQLADLRVAVVDDVMTTGATASAAALCLLRAGAAAVDIWVLARTPEH